MSVRFARQDVQIEKNFSRCSSVNFGPLYQPRQKILQAIRLYQQIPILADFTLVRCFAVECRLTLYQISMN